MIVLKRTMAGGALGGVAGVAVVILSMGVLRIVTGGFVGGSPFDPINVAFGFVFGFLVGAVAWAARVRVVARAALVSGLCAVSVPAIWLSLLVSIGALTPAKYVQGLLLFIPAFVVQGAALGVIVAAAYRRFGAEFEAIPAPRSRRRRRTESPRIRL